MNDRDELRAQRTEFEQARQRVSIAAVVVTVIGIALLAGGGRRRAGGPVVGTLRGRRLRGTAQPPPRVRGDPPAGPRRVGPAVIGIALLAVGRVAMAISFGLAPTLLMLLILVLLILAGNEWMLHRRAASSQPTAPTYPNCGSSSAVAARSDVAGYRRRHGTS